MPSPRRRNRAATALAGVLAAGILYAATDGLRAFTAEAARRLAVREVPRPMPSLDLEDHLGRRLDPARLRGRRLAVAFVYARCPDVCLRLADSMAELHARLSTRGVADARLLSVSFDPDAGEAARLQNFAALQRADGRLWRFARPLDPAALERWLEAWDVVVVSDGSGGFVHNAALHLVDEAGRLVRIVDREAVEEAARFLAPQEVAAR